MRRIHGWVVPAVVSGLVASGCGRPPAPAPLVRSSLTVPELVGIVRARTEAVTTLQAGIELVWEDPGTGKSERCSASVTYERGEGLRVNATSAAFFTVFELIAGPDSVWLDIPREGLTVVGERGDPEWDNLPVSPRTLLIALLADPWAAGVPGGEEAVQGTGGDARLAGPGWELRLDPATAVPQEYQEAAVRILWSDWFLRRGVPWPHDAEIRSPAGGVRARLGRLRADRGVRDGLFTFAPPEDRELLSPREAGIRWQEGLGGR